MNAAGLEGVASRIEELEALDSLSEKVQSAARAAVPASSPLKDVLSGTWLGHPLHPPLTDAVVGSWTSALLLDLLGGEELGPAADRLVAAGSLLALPTALAGLSDWAELRGASRRLGAVHALGNTTALLLHALSWAARRRGRRGMGVALSATGYGIAAGSAWLGGQLSFSKGVGVNQTAFDDGPDEWTAVAEEDEVGEGRLVGRQADGVGILLVRHGGEIHALDDRCSHRGCALHEGELVDGRVVCACHGSTYELDGSLVKGPATSPQPAFATRVHEGRIEIRRADDD